MSGNYLGWFSLLEQKLDLVRAPCPFGFRMKRKIECTMQLASRLMLLDGAFILTQYILLAYQQTLLLHSIT
jgi:hypothetical protein